MPDVNESTGAEPNGHVELEQTEGGVGADGVGQGEIQQLDAVRPVGQLVAGSADLGGLHDGRRPAALARPEQAGKSWCGRGPPSPHLDRRAGRPVDQRRGVLVLLELDPASTLQRVAE
jgi:hypothetical protein